MLLLRAFYVRFGSMKNEESMKTKELIAKCLCKTDEFGTAILNELKIDSEVATYNDKEEFLEILKTDEVIDNQKSKYANNYRFFQKKIEEFLNEYLDVFSYLPIRILNNCILLPIEADNQNIALRKFYEKDDYAILKKEQTLDNLSTLADFWNDVANQDEKRFSKKILRKLFILNYAPNGMWNYFASVYFMQNKDSENMKDKNLIK